MDCEHEDNVVYGSLVSRNGFISVYNVTCDDCKTTGTVTESDEYGESTIIAEQWSTSI